MGQVFLTILKKRFIESIDNVKTLGLYSLNDDQLNRKNENELYKTIKKQIPSHDLIIVCDYGHGLISKKIANLIDDIEIEIEKYYANKNGNKYNKLSEFYNWFIQEKKLNLKTNLKSEFPSNQSIENLIDSIDL